MKGLQRTDLELFLSECVWKDQKREHFLVRLVGLIRSG